ncbi:uncharacterized protein LOC125026357 [Penaeus chinensis]|uniref:uncharacterized protein LOC125026357 n=1 Tax=Penaeus chinensis TaxID=139456 RepID=UPI001FB7419F|nr:uncharacterized protein LOC125026357 [Penaeus chinensis]XP_047470706.1 uncharacterized protein LOC125026357 [Penaeus chinensis]XP_047470707.1 uncharacterized protein LOC125026357 [Penaeus chinensis]XP_047470708.1 uncharacterized protein LOC125026357 [Penaeus chinensis]XP_047470709.1 uncharacterized protein LOC125026357 [Penaeus chinensis]XP_047470711.1 uncharacterized protein LOC125026357 [Penaeus chinensis]XP_047470712.1 uncharacterized protein LOC125026357 [Penaeus chinensis]
MLPTTSSVLLPDDHLLLRYYAAVFRVVRPVFCKILQLLSSSRSNWKELLLHCPGYSSSQYRKEFGDQERYLLDNNAPCEQFDISLLFKLLQRICGLAARNHSSWSSPGTLENHLQCLKNYRNELAHKDLQLSQAELQQRILAIRNGCREALVLSGQKSHTRVDALIREVEDSLDEVMTAGVDLWEPYREAVQTLRLERQSLVIREGKKEISNHAQKLRILNPFAWLTDDHFSYLDISEIFTEVQIMGKGYVRLEDLLITTLPSSQYPYVIVLCGCPGIGKTSLVRFLLHDWLSTTPSVSGMRDFELVMPVELRHVSSKSVEQLLREQLIPETCRHFHQDDVVPILQEVSLLWLVDGFDEGNEDALRVTEELLSKFRNSRVIITSRRECVNEIQLMLSNHHLASMEYNMVGLYDEDRELYVHKLFNVYSRKQLCDKSQCLDFINYIKKENHLTLILSVPLYLVMLFTLWLENPTIINRATTVTSLFQLLVDHIVTRMSKRRKFITLRLAEREIQRKIRKILNKFGEAFWENSSQRKFCLTKYQLDQMEDMCENLGLPFRETMSPFFIVQITASSIGTEEMYEPLHRTVQEFLAAQSFCKEMIDTGRDVLTLAAQWKEQHEQYLENAAETDDASRSHCSNFMVKKLHEAKSSSFEDFKFITTKNMFSNRPCCYSDMVVPCSEVEDPDEFERYLIYTHFSPIFYGSLIPVFMVGYLKAHKALTKTRSEQIVYICICELGNIKQYNLWISLIKEAEDDPVMIKEIQDQVGSFEWCPRYSSWISVLALMEFVIPKSISIHACDNYDANIEATVHKISHFNTELVLDLRNWTMMNYLELTKKCLTAALHTEASCSVTYLSCRADREILELLARAHHLEGLSVRVDTLEDLQNLSKIILTLPKLKDISILPMFTLSNVPYKDLPTFSICHMILVKRRLRWNMLMGVSKARSFMSFFQFGSETFTLDLPAGKLPSLMCRRKSPALVFRVKRKRGRHSQRSRDPSTIPYPEHLQMFESSIELVRKLYGLPSAHCHKRCVWRKEASVLCPKECCHSFSALDTQVHSNVRGKSHHIKAIRYHRRTLIRLRSLYNTLWKFLCEVYGRSCGTYRRIYDQNIRVMCIQLHDQETWEHIEDPNIYLLKVCELLMYQHLICIQQHKRFLIRSNRKFRSVAPVRLIIVDAFSLAPKHLATAVHKLCQKPMGIYLHGSVDMSVGLDDLAEYVWQLGTAFPYAVDIEFEIPVYSYEMENIPILTSVISSLKLLVEKSAPIFNFDAYLTLEI